MLTRKLNKPIQTTASHNKMEEILILNAAISALKKAPYAHYYLGCLLYDKKQYDKAVNEWKESISENPKYAMAYRKSCDCLL